MRAGALLPVLVLGAGVGCSRPNPGFEVALKPDTTGSVGDSSSSSSEAPTTTEVTAAPMTTTGETTSAVDPSTTTETSSTSASETSSESSSTGDVEVVWPMDCEERVTTPAGTAIADTFLVNSVDLDMKCLDDDNAPGECMDQALGKVPTFQVFYTDDGSPQQEHLAGLFAARFGPPEAVYMGEEVPPGAILGVVVTVWMARAESNKPIGTTQFRVYRMPEAELRWEEGSNTKLSPCKTGAASFRCQSCLVDPEMPGSCDVYWSTPEPKLPFVRADEPLMKVDLKDPGMGMNGDVVIPVEQDWEWLFADGVLLVPEVLTNQRVVVRAREYEDEMARPTISVVHCPYEAKN